MERIPCCGVYACQKRVIFFGNKIVGDFLI